MMKNSKVFIACICDDYVLNEECRMEFQYAKSTLRKPVVPVVIGNSTEWTMSVVGKNQMFSVFNRGKHACMHACMRACVNTWMCSHLHICINFVVLRYLCLINCLGMLIAGELYIHFKDKSVEEQKLQEVVRSLAIHISSLTQEIQQEEHVKLGPGN